MFRSHPRSALLTVALVAASASAALAGRPLTPFSECREDRQHNNSEAIYRICTPPDTWVNNGELVLWAHGYVDEFAPLEIPESQLCFTDNVCMNDLVNFLGYGFATTSYAVNGLAVVPGIEDVKELVDLYTDEVGTPPTRVYLVGASEGGLITTLAVEQNPEIFDGGLALCGPIGDFPQQTNYFGDFRAVFDYYFPDLIPGDPTDIPQDLIDDWDNYYATEVRPILSDPANQATMNDVIKASQAAAHPSEPRRTAEIATDDLLWYSVFATNNGVDVLMGQPYDNIDKVYRGTRDDEALNAGVQRIAADPAAIAEMEANYQTSGVLEIPLVTYHTILDQQVPERHEKLYLAKTQASGSWPEFHVPLEPAQVYGHCLFPLRGVLDAFCELVFQVSGQMCDFDVVRELEDRLGGGEQLLPMHRLDG